MKSRAPLVFLMCVVAVGGLVLNGYANSLARASIQAFTMEMQTVIGAPVVWIAYNFPVLQLIGFMTPLLLFAAVLRKWMSELTCFVAMVALMFVWITWFITVAFFSAQPGIIG